MGETEFARDATFGYRSSNLLEFVREKCGDVPVSSIRAGEPARRRARVGVVNAETYDDLDAVVRAVRASGRRFLYRTGPSFVRSLAGIEPIAPLTDLGHRDGHGLLVVGSHVGLTTRQIEAVEGLREIELDVTALDPEGVGAASPTRCATATSCSTPAASWSAGTTRWPRPGRSRRRSPRSCAPRSTRARRGSSPRAASPPTTSPSTASGSAARPSSASCCRAW